LDGIYSFAATAGFSLQDYYPYLYYGRRGRDLDGDGRRIQEENGEQGKGEGENHQGLYCQDYFTVVEATFTDELFNSASYSSTVDSLSSLNTLLGKVSCFQIYDRDNNLDYATDLLTSSESCSVYDGSMCPDPYGKLQACEKKFEQIEAKLSNTANPARESVNGSSIRYAIGSVLYVAAAVVILWKMNSRKVEVDNDDQSPSGKVPFDSSQDWVIDAAPPNWTRGDSPSHKSPSRKSRDEESPSRKSPIRRSRNGSPSKTLSDGWKPRDWSPSRKSKSPNRVSHDESPIRKLTDLWKTRDDSPFRKSKSPRKESRDSSPDSNPSDFLKSHQELPNRLAKSPSRKSRDDVPSGTPSDLLKSHEDSPNRTSKSPRKNGHDDSPRRKPADLLTSYDDSPNRLSNYSPSGRSMDLSASHEDWPNTESKARDDDSPSKKLASLWKHRGSSPRRQSKSPGRGDDTFALSFEDGFDFMA